MKRNFIIILIIANILAINPSLSFDNKKLDSLLTILEENDKFMGSLAVAHQGNIIYSRSVGFDDIDGNEKSTINTKYRIGSISKMFTAALIFIALEEEKLELDQTIDKYFPDIMNSSDITIGNLLNHRSGIHSFTDDSSYMNWYTEPQTRMQMIDLISQSKSEFKPNTKSQYSNSNYVLLTFILESIYNRSFSSLLQKKILEPIGMENTYVGSRINIKANECYSYKYIDGWKKENETDMSVPLGAGSIVSNPTDLIIFITSLFSYEIISKENLKQMKNIVDHYGMGMFLFKFEEKTGYGHTGGIDGFSSFLEYFPEDELGVALTSNATSYRLSEITKAALSSFYGKEFAIPAFKDLNLITEDLDKYLGTYSSDLIPMKINITKDGTTLIAQATGQQPIHLEASDVNVFRFDYAGVVLEFMPEKKEMILKQGGGEFTFTKD